MNIKTLLKKLIFPSLQAPNPNAPACGLFPYSRESEGNVNRFHLRIELDGTALLIANASRLLMLSKSGAFIVKLLLENTPPDKIRRAVRKAFHGATQEEVESDLHRLQEIIDRPSLIPGGFFFDAEYFSESPEYWARLSAPLSADLEVSTTSPVSEIITALFDSGIPQLTLLAPAAPLTEELAQKIVSAVETAEDRGMIAGVRIEASALLSFNLIQRLAQAGLDYAVIPFASIQESFHDSMFSAGDFSAAKRALNDLREIEITAVPQVVLFPETLTQLGDILQFFQAEEIANVVFFPLVQPDTGPIVQGVLQEGMLAQMKTAVEEESLEHGMGCTWQPVRAFSFESSIASQVRLGPRCQSEFSLRVVSDGTVIPPRGPFISVGNILKEPWKDIWLRLTEQKNSEAQARGDE